MGNYANLIINDTMYGMEIFIGMLILGFGIAAIASLYKYILDSKK